MRALALRLALLSALCLAITATSASAAAVVNGDFSSDLTGWTVTTETPGSAGAWTAYSSAALPLSGGGVVGHVQLPDGKGAVADQSGEMSSVLTQDVVLEAGFTHSLSFRYWLYNAAADWITPNPLSYLLAGDGQIVVIDVIKPTASPTSADPADVLATVYRSAPGDSKETGWRNATLDLSAFAGQTVKLRFLDTNTANFLLIGLDDVAISSKDATAPALTGISTASASYTEGAKNAGFSRKFTANEAGTLSAAFAKQTEGRKSGKKCVKKTSKNKAAKKCNYWAALKGNLTQAVTPGTNTFKFTGKLGGKRLKPGKYKVTLTLADASGNAAKPVTIKFTVKPKKK